MKGPSLFDRCLRRVVLCCYYLYMSISNICEETKRRWKKCCADEKTGRSRKIFTIRVPPLSTGVKAVLLVVVLMAVFIYGWNYVLLNQSWESLTRYTKVPFLSNKEAMDVATQKEVVRRMFDKGVIQAVLVLGDYTPISYLTISSLLESIAGQTSGGGIDSSKKPFVFIGSSSRVYKEGNDSYHRHFGFSLGEHEIALKSTEVLYQWIHSILDTTTKIDEKFNLTEIIHKYESDPHSIQPMIFVDFDVLSALCAPTIAPMLKLVPKTKLFGVMTPEDTDRLIFLFDSVHNNISCMCNRECENTKQRSNILYGGGSICFKTDEELFQHVTKEKDVQSVCSKSATFANGMDTFSHCCGMKRSCYSSSVGEYVDESCKWKYHTVCLSKQRKLFTYLSRANFYKENIFIMDLLSYMENPTPMEKDFSDFLSIDYGSEGTISGSYTKGDSMQCLENVVERIDNHKDDKQSYTMLLSLLN